MWASAVKVGMIVGATGGIGGACARALVDAADRVVLTGRNDSALHALAGELGPRAVPVVADVVDQRARERIVDAIGLGQVSWVVLAAGMPLRESIVTVDPEEIRRTFEVNLVAPTLLIRRLLDCSWNRPASIVVIGSIAAGRALPNRSIYGASKAAIEHLARAMATEVASRGIRVNVVAPGVVETPFLGSDSGALTTWAKTRVPVGRLGSPEEIAAVTRFVIVDSPDFMTASRLVVDGGAEVML
jgi:NAD(P)-dependent dehydrogenase (short-subunit alcohol dehydrogenase family)